MSSLSSRPPISAATAPLAASASASDRSAGSGEPGSEVTSTLINLCGRQRMLSQRLMLHLVLAAQGDEAALATARDALNLFSDCHGVLSRGKGILPAPWTTALQEAFFGLQGADAPVRAFMSMARQALERIEQGAGRSIDGPLAPELTLLVDASTSVLAHLNHLTHCYETAAHEAARRQRQQLLDLIGRIRHIAQEAHSVSSNARADTSAAEPDPIASVLAEISAQITQLAETARRVH
ncbi:MAG: hypothetical protein RLY71_2228 [Pseudomonadota bacterium]|jgi:hypothetical protein